MFVSIASSRVPKKFYSTTTFQIYFHHQYVLQRAREDVVVEVNKWFGSYKGLFLNKKGFRLITMVNKATIDYERPATISQLILLLPL